MGRDIRSALWCKALAAVLAILCGALAVLSWVYCAVYWDTLFGQEDWTSSPACQSQLSLCHSQLQGYTVYSLRVRRGESLSYLEQRELEELTAALAPEATNFRYTVRDNETGALLYSSQGADSLSGVLALQQFVLSAPWSETWIPVYDSQRQGYVWYDQDGLELAAPSAQSSSAGEAEAPAPSAPARSVPAGSSSLQGAALTPAPSAEGDVDADAGRRDLILECGIAPTLSVRDGFLTARDAFQGGDPGYFLLAVGLTLGFLVFSVLTMCCAGRRRGAEGFVLNWQDRLPYDLYLCLCAGGICLGAVGAIDALESAYFNHPGEDYGFVLLGLAGLCLAGAFLLLTALLATTATRVKTRTLWKNTLLWRLLAGSGRLLRRLTGHFRAFLLDWPLTRRPILLFSLFLLVNGVLSFYFWRGIPWADVWPLFLALLLLWNGLALHSICRWARQWRQVRRGLEGILSGSEAPIPTQGLYRDLRDHVQDLNHLSVTVQESVDRQLKSQRFQAELITNVSHDLKTPLTSIINYVDLLKKTDQPDPAAREYLDVLERKSQRLKKLTEDLVEASKASTGVLPVRVAPLGLWQLAEQALAEYADKLAQRGLDPVVVRPPEEVTVLADGRHLWRVLDNLLGNCVKYALPGTRVYLLVDATPGGGRITVKNISAQPLNMTPDELMARFVRGDAARSTEGSGLGLSIAQSLTQLQGGSFSLAIDADLFTAQVTLPYPGPNPLPAP